MRGEVSLGIGSDELGVLKFPINGDTKRFSKEMVLNKLRIKVIVDLFAE
jgi:hypothetical protein